LGGKSPFIVDSDADIDFAAKKVAFGKFANAG
jgi:aldehyde dehydrogenase (NAD+)